MRKYGAGDGKITQPSDNDENLSRTAGQSWTEKDAQELAEENEQTDKD